MKHFFAKEARDLGLIGGESQVEKLERENRELRIELNKAVQDDCQVFLKIREFTPDQIQKWDPDVKAAVRAQMTAAINRVKTLFGEGVGAPGSTMVSQFIISAQGVMALLDCEQI